MSSSSSSYNYAYLLHLLARCHNRNHSSWKSYLHLRPSWRKNLLHPNFIRLLTSLDKLVLSERCFRARVGPLRIPIKPSTSKIFTLIEILFLIIRSQHLPNLKFNVMVFLSIVNYSETKLAYFIFIFLEIHMSYYLRKSLRFNLISQGLEIARICLKHNTDLGNALLNHKNKS